MKNTFTTFFLFSGLAGIQNARQGARQDFLSVLELGVVGADYFDHAYFISKNLLFVRRHLATPWLFKIQESFKKGLQITLKKCIKKRYFALESLEVFSVYFRSKFEKFRKVMDLVVPTIFLYLFTFSCR